jgi:3-isopropylmalate/(R)-2-methylmalate dehydratase large subunit
MVVVPPSPKNAVSLSEAAGTVINQGYIGSCACGRLEDLAVAARVLKGRKLAPGRRLYVVPSSGEVMRLASKLGYLDDIIGAGAFVASSSCDFCSGRQGALDNGEKAMSTGPLNVPGRMGNLNADIYIGSAASVAAAVVAGEITDPREFL